jgi:hypothetical protein
MVDKYISQFRLQLNDNNSTTTSTTPFNEQQRNKLEAQPSGSENKSSIEISDENEQLQIDLIHGLTGALATVIENEKTADLGEARDDTKNNILQHPQERMHQEQAVNVDERPAEWQSYLEDAAKNDNVQRFGLEIELKNAKIPYHAAGNDNFKNFAVQRGHKGFMVNDWGVELHLDHGTKDNAILELVLTPGVPYMDFLRKLNKIRGLLLNKPTDRSWLEAGFEWKGEKNDEIENYIKDNIKGTSAVVGMPVQVTTTHTATELKEVLKSTSEQFMTSRDSGNKTSINIREILNIDPRKKQEKVNDIDSFIVNRLLGNITPLVHRDDEGKGSNAIIKHASEQFNNYERNNELIPLNTPVDRIRKDTSPLNQLHTYANKPAPVFKRNGEVAYVIEYRTGSDIAHFICQYLSEKIDFNTLQSKFINYIGRK